MIAYKLFYEAPPESPHDLETFLRCPWRIGEWKETSGNGPLCSRGWLHAYSHPQLGEMMNPSQGQYSDEAVMYQVEIDPEAEILEPYGLKLGANRMRPLEKYPRRKLLLDERMEIALRCLSLVSQDEYFLSWAPRWLSGEDRSEAMAISLQARCSTYRSIGENEIARAAVWRARVHSRLLEEGEERDPEEVYGSSYLRRSCALVITEATLNTDRPDRLLEIITRELRTPQ
jgi:hypothetical protein